MNDSSGLRAAIRATSAFRDLSEDDISFLIEAGDLRTFEPDAILMAQGEQADAVMLILAGEVTVTTDSPRGVIPISTIRAPCLVGETGALAQLPRTATVRAQTVCTCISLERGQFNRLMEGFPELHQRLSAIAVERLRESSKAVTAALLV